MMPRDLPPDGAFDRHCALYACVFTPLQRPKPTQ
jgi:hypothetical protein